jgi:hypothetical protein
LSEKAGANSLSPLLENHRFCGSFHQEQEIGKVFQRLSCIQILWSESLFSDGKCMEIRCFRFCVPLLRFIYICQEMKTGAHPVMA